MIQKLYLNKMAITKKGILDIPPSGGSSGAVDSIFGRIGAVIAQTGDYDAQKITNIPSGNITATNIQSAVNEIDVRIDNINLDSFINAIIF